MSHKASPLVFVQGDQAVPFVKTNMPATSQVKTGLAAVKASFKDIFSEEDNFVEKTWEVK